MPTYYYIAASKRFLIEEESLDEVLEERTRNYHEQEKEIDFWFIEQPAFLQAPELAETGDRVPQPAAAVITTDPQLITWLKLRLEYVASGQFGAPSETIPDPLASLTAA
ncbi:MAG: MgPME-cyclase complex family protein [Elainellaceae cyanobacterium]